MWGGRLDDHHGLTTWCNHLRDLGYFGMMITRPYQPISENDSKPQLASFISGQQRRLGF